MIAPTVRSWQAAANLHRARTLLALARERPLSPDARLLVLADLKAACELLTAEAEAQLERGMNLAAARERQGRPVRFYP